MTQIRDAILDHIETTSFASLPPAVVSATNVVIADTMACALKGSAESKAKTIRSIQLTHFGFGGVPIWGTDDLIAPLGAGLANGYQTHCLGYASIHETSGVEPLSVIFPAVMAFADRYGQVTGEQLITALNIGTDVAVLLGLAATQDPSFSRTSVCGAMGAGAAIAKLAGFDRPSTAELFGLIYSQLSGTMQAQDPAEAEASIAEPLQVAFSVRNVLTAYDMIHMKLTGPADVFDGPYGYFKLFEPEGNATPFLKDLGKIWRMAELSGRPFTTESPSPSSPDSKMPADQQLEKFLGGATAAAQPLSADAANTLHQRLLSLEKEKDVSIVSHLASGLDLEEEII